NPFYSEICLFVLSFRAAGHMPWELPAGPPGRTINDFFTKIRELYLQKVCENLYRRLLNHEEIPYYLPNIASVREKKRIGSHNPNLKPNPTMDSNPNPHPNPFSIPPTFLISTLSNPIPHHLSAPSNLLSFASIDSVSKRMSIS